MKRLILLLTSAACLALAADKPDLSGNWQLNLGKSKLSKQTGKPDSMSLVVAPKGSGYHAIQTTVDGTVGSSSTEGDWYLDGQYHPVGDSKVTQMSKWDGKILYAEKKSYDGSVMETIRMTISPDGKTATEQMSSKSPNGTVNTTLVWNKK